MLPRRQIALSTSSIKYMTLSACPENFLVGPQESSRRAQSSKFRNLQIDTVLTTDYLKWHENAYNTWKKRMIAALYHLLLGEKVWIQRKQLNRDLAAQLDPQATKDTCVCDKNRNRDRFTLIKEIDENYL